MKLIRSYGCLGIHALITPSVDTTILSMKGTNLLVNGTSLFSVLLNALKGPISSSALSKSNSATPFPALFLRGGIPCLSFSFFFFFFFFFFLTGYVPVEVSGICLYITLPKAKSPGSATITNRSPFQTPRGSGNRQIQTSTNRTNVRKALKLALSYTSEVIAMLKGLKNTRTNDTR